MVKRFYKHKLLLDENMLPRVMLSSINEYFDVKHVDHDLKLGGISDREVYKLAVSQKRIILTHNVKHFVPLAGTLSDFGVIAIPSHWKPDLLDSKLTALLKKRSSSYFKGKIITLTDGKS